MKQGWGLDSYNALKIPEDPLGITNTTEPLEQKYITLAFVFLTKFAYIKGYSYRFCSGVFVPFFCLTAILQGGATCVTKFCFAYRQALWQ